MKRKSNDNLRDLIATTTGLPTGILAGSGAARPGFNLQFHLGKLESDADCSGSSSPRKGNCRGLEQSPSCLWSIPVADDGKQGQHATQHRPSITQQSDVPNLSVLTILPRYGNRGPNGEADHRVNRPPNPSIAIIFCTVREEHIATSQQHQKSNQQGPKNSQKEKLAIGGRNNRRPPTNVLALTGPSQGDRVQCRD
ncbi:hypothetical protein A4A49_12094 [Nicotiana attenuata]|uniref:Uncharacterized protein n=1 Tax=Nicotiana attenuata TaxID=49451 RepID=A0A1J6IYH2_NICAT|nr:hypothetical protein A4A49_12094 [Nicotiana attenuata]